MTEAMTQEQDNIERVAWTLQDPDWKPTRAYVVKMLGAYKEAVAEVERLTVLLAEKREAVTHWKTQLNEALTDNDRLQAAIEWLMKQPWKSIDKDNMEFQVTVSCYVRDALRRALETKPVFVTDLVLTDEQVARLKAAWGDRGDVERLCAALKLATVALDTAECVIDADDEVEAFHQVQTANKAVKAALEPKPIEELEPHAYVPSAMHMGDCYVCGNLQGHAIHSPFRRALEP